MSAGCPGRRARLSPVIFALFTPASIVAQRPHHVHPRRRWQGLGLVARARLLRSMKLEEARHAVTRVQSVEDVVAHGVSCARHARAQRRGRRVAPDGRGRPLAARPLMSHALITTPVKTLFDSKQQNATFPQVEVLYRRKSCNTSKRSKTLLSGLFVPEFMTPQSPRLHH